MNWQSQLLDKFRKLNLELEPAPNFNLKDLLTNGVSKVLIVAPNMPSKRDQAAIKKIIPEDIEVEFTVRVKASTLNRMLMTVQQCGYGVNEKLDPMNRDLKLAFVPVQGMQQTETSVFVDGLSKIIFEDGFYRSWSFTVDGQEFAFNRDVIKAISTHKAPTAEINPIDLRILLESTSSVEEFLTQI